MNVSGTITIVILVKADVPVCDRIVELLIEPMVPDSPGTLPWDDELLDHNVQRC